jgi:hypothetical protein
MGVMACLFGTGVLVCAMTVPGALPKIINSITVIETKAIIFFSSLYSLFDLTELLRK